MNRLTVHVSDDLLQALDELAAKAHQTRSDMVRQALHTLVRQQNDKAPDGSLLDAVADLVGCFSGGPEDLASNAIHLAEFGKD